MSNVNKAVLPKEVAEAIESMRADGYDNGIIIRLALGEAIKPYTSRVKTVRDYATELTEELVSAIVNGYDVEKTPEEKVRALYDSYDPTYVKGEIAQTAIEETLDALGIKYEGVNA